MNITMKLFLFSYKLTRQRLYFNLFALKVKRELNIACYEIKENY